MNRCSSLIAAAMLSALAAGAQFRGFEAATVAPSAPVKLEAGGETRVPVVVRIRPGYHINSNTPAEDYLIPTQIAWDVAPLRVVRIEYPEPEIVEYAFSDKPLSVYSGEVEIVAVLRTPSGGASAESLNGALHYQACNDKACLPPSSAKVSVPVAR